MTNQFTFKTSVHIDFLLSVDRDEFIEYLLQDDEVGKIISYEPVDVSNQHITMLVVYKMPEWKYMDYLAELDPRWQMNEYGQWYKGHE